MIIGLTGTLGAGKTTVIDFLKEKGFKHYSVRAYLKEKIEEQGLPLNRDSMVIVANKLRQQNSPSFIIEELYEKSKQDTNSIIESIRTEGEVQFLKKQQDFILIAVDANQEIRYKRIKERASETDHITLEEFKANEKREMTSDDPSKQNLAKCIELSDYKIDNSGTLEDLKKQIDSILNNF